ncbi:hypothetical protein F442_19045 [Phytophthora nicotianae P10297]|uniref:Uncharacterized protein n=1 Tax=Phytophthora nicotianae P10297 TaxID=1317064 RepID=W2YC22_PHYNI|nr:hypothetical protein F442_19045 [Phytophthora nicotianae P10297]
MGRSFQLLTTEDLDNVLAAIKYEASQSKFPYVLVGGVEIGDRPYQNDYLLKHVHCALIYANRVSKSSILKNLNVKQGLYYYLVPRKGDPLYSGCRDHHVKPQGKVNSEYVLFEQGRLP